MPAGIQHGMDATCALGWLEKDLHAASRPETLYDEEGEFLLIFLRKLRIFRIKQITIFIMQYLYMQFCLVLVIDLSKKLSLCHEQIQIKNRIKLISIY